MTIRLRLTLLFTLVVSVLLGLFSLVIYFLAEQHRRTEFYERLRAEATTSVQLLFDQQTISRDLFQLLDKNQLTVLYNEEIVIYNAKDSLLYESGTDYMKITPEILSLVKQDKEVQWRENQREFVGVHYRHLAHDYSVFASAIDRYGFSKNQNLAWVLLVGWGLATLVVFAVGWVYARRALQPLQKLVAKMDDITVSRLDLRVKVTNDHDEIGQLAHRFNQMLDRLEEAFRMQRAFVSNASHELRTPLTAITGQIEVALMDNDPQEWENTLYSVLEDVRNLNRLSNGLLSLASVNMDESTLKTSVVPLDEVFWQTRKELLKAYPHYTVNVDMELLSPDTMLTINGAETLLQIAMMNLMENGCKFSPTNTVNIAWQLTPQNIEIRFHNQGPAIAPDELPFVFKPFWRGSNAHKIKGHGIGMPLTERIVKLHHGQISVTSNEEEGTIFTVSLPRVLG
ncbi:MAG: ATP-binding protein [Runella sp.]